METLDLILITPKKIIFEKKVYSVTAPSIEGEVTILPRHIPLLTLLDEGIIKIKNTDGSEEYLAIGGGYLQTNGDEIKILVSRAYKQDELDEAKINEAINQAKAILSKSKTEEERRMALQNLRRSIIDLKLIKRRKKLTSS